ncbi:MAG: TraB/GumN family protein [Theionarchaea archaeon]|nr:TraB/GumN family protein [Theionarchaea archaeon]
MKEELLLGENRIILVGTGHVFQESVDLARSTILEVRPDHVAVELDYHRMKALQSKPQEKPSFRDMLKMGVRIAILGSIFAYFQSKVGEETGVFPGAEMHEAMKAAEEVGANIELIDQNMVVTLNRLISTMSVFTMLKIIFYMLLPSKISVDAIDETMVDDMTHELHHLSPSAHRVLLEERDLIMAHNILDLSGTIVVVVGAGHVKGIKKHLIESYKNYQMEET